LVVATENSDFAVPFIGGNLLAAWLVALAIGRRNSPTSAGTTEPA
jgi:hypothetical protein